LSAFSIEIKCKTFPDVRKQKIKKNTQTEQKVVSRIIAAKAKTDEKRMQQTSNKAI